MFVWFSMTSYQTYSVKQFEVPQDKTNKITFAPSNDLDQSGHLPSLIKVVRCEPEESLGP